jgi:hypothetical protein
MVFKNLSKNYKKHLFSEKKNIPTELYKESEKLKGEI